VHEKNGKFSMASDCMLNALIQLHKIKMRENDEDKVRLISEQISLFQQSFDDLKSKIDKPLQDQPQGNKKEEEEEYLILDEDWDDEGNEEEDGMDEYMMHFSQAVVLDEGGEEERAVTSYR